MPSKASTATDVLQLPPPRSAAAKSKTSAVTHRTAAERAELGAQAGRNQVERILTQR